MEVVIHNKKNLLTVANKDGNSFYSYEIKLIQTLFETSIDSLPAVINFFYSIKANFNVAIFHELKMPGAERCSYRETYE